MTRRASAEVPLRLVLVTAEALLHRRKRGAAGLDHSRVTRHALSREPFHRQMPIVIERDGPIRMLGHDRHDRLQRRAGVVMAGSTDTGGGKLLDRPVDRKCVARVAAQAGRFARRTARQASQVQLMRKARCRAFEASHSQRAEQQ